MSKLPADTDWKPLVTSWFCGGSLTPTLMTTNGRIYGKAALRRLAKDDRTVEFRSEVVKGTAFLLKRVAQWSTVDCHRTPTNAGGATLTLDGKRGDSGRAASHFYTGLEQLAIRHCCRHATGLQAIIFDGFHAAQQDTARLEKHIADSSFQHLGFPLTLRLKAEPLATASLPY